MHINESRPLERLVGVNYGVIRQRLGNIHCMTSVLDASREVRPKGMRDMPVELRRGLALCIMETLAEYRGTFISVMHCREMEPKQLGAFD